MRRSASRRSPEAIEPQSETVAIRLILSPLRETKQPAIQSLDGLEHRPILLGEETFGDVQPIVWVDANQVGIEGSVMDF